MFVEFVDKLTIRLHQAMEGKQKCRVVRQQPKSLFSTGLQKTKEEVIVDRQKIRRGISAKNRALE